MGDHMISSAICMGDHMISSAICMGDHMISSAIWDKLARVTYFKG